MKTAILLSIFLAGCSSAYKPDLEGKPVATLRIASVHPAEARVAALEGECVPFVRGDWEKKSRAITVLKDGNSVYQKVPAGQPLSLSFFTSTTTVAGDVATDAVCSVAMRFTPEGGANYEAVFAGDADNCRLEIGKMRPQTGEGARTEPVKDAKELPGC
ncbi:MAG: hypothetical protein QOD26_2045 [Betaproteobacteria bacterium]|jgi:hypothetical protein|nr:hypothetical protein [Betaproteobacteria bacterium]